MLNEFTFTTIIIFGYGAALLIATVAIKYLLACVGKDYLLPWFSRSYFFKSRSSNRQAQKIKQSSADSRKVLQQKDKTQEYMI